MTDKKTEKMCKEIDEEGYYRWIEQRDEKRFRWINILKKGKVKKLFRLLLHMTGIHNLDHQAYVKTIDGKDLKIYSCATCGYECTEKGVAWEFFKYFTVWGIIVGLALSPVSNYLPPLLAESFFFLLIFFIIVHLLTGVQGFLELMGA